MEILSLHSKNILVRGSCAYFLEIAVLEDILFARQFMAVGANTMSVRNRAVNYLFACAVTAFSITLYVLHQDLFPDANPAWGSFFGLSLFFAHLLNIEDRL